MSCRGGRKQGLMALLGAVLALFMLAGGALPARAAERLVLAYGDSLTAGYGLAPADSYPARLQTLLRAQGVAVRIHNAGISGDTSVQGRARLGWVLAALKHKPDLVLLCLGANDALRGFDPAITTANLDAMLTELNRRGIRTLLIGMQAPPNMGQTYARRYNALFPQLARKHRVQLYPFMLAGVAANPKFNLADGMHPNSEGTAVIARNLAPQVRSALKGG